MAKPIREIEGDEPAVTPSTQPSMVDEFRKEYRLILADTEEMARMTDTDAWRKQFAQRRDGLRAGRSMLAKTLEMAASTVIRPEFDESTLESIKQAGKDLDELNDSFLAFVRIVIEPARKAVEACDDCRLRWTSKAREVAQRAELFQPRLIEDMAEAQAGVVKPTWDEESGAIILCEPAKPE